MKRLVKWMLILSVVFFVLGTGVIAAGVMMGGGYYLGQALRAADRWDDDFADWGRDFPGREEVVTDWETDVPGSKGFPDREGFLDSEELPDGVISERPGSMELPLEGAHLYEDVRKLEAEVDGKVFFQESSELSDGQIRISRSGDGEDYEYRQEGNTLKIRWPRHAGRLHESLGNTIMITVPAECPLEEIDIEVAAGAFQADIMRAREISLQVEAGAIQVMQAEADKLELEADAGQICCQANVAREVSAESELGEILLDLAGKKEDFNYELECSAGSIVLQGSEPEEYQGLHHEIRLDHGAFKKAELECSAGSIVVSYREEE